uniref:GRF-type domain-containing protein n=1 Tax=Cyprinus carpio carpio TaxID=630221 RepID=A0A9J8B300_CYPCA
MAEVPLSKALNPQLLPGRWIYSCPLLRVCVHGVFTSHCCVCALGWVKCRAPISSMDVRTRMGCAFTGVETLGKELLMYFGYRALRFPDSFRFYIEPLKILTPQGIIILFASPRLSENCEQRVRAMEALDICLTKFSFSEAVEAVKRESERILCDVLLDQTVLPGVGNIIKNEACYFSKNSSVAHKAGTFTFESGPDPLPRNSFSKPLQEIKMNRKTAFGTTTLVLTNLSAKPDSTSSPAINQAHTLETMSGQSTRSTWQWKSPSNGVSGMQFRGNEPYKRESPADHSQPNKRMKTMNGALSGGSMYRGTQSNDTSLPPTPCCKSHHRPCTLRVVTKEGENKGRQFYTCSLPRETQCNLFEWADLHFPMCHHGKRTLMKTVLKLGPKNGHNFYTCPVKMDKQCNFFQWAENGPGISILPGC